MTEYTTIRVTQAAKDAAEDSKRESETWNDYIERCTDNPPEVREFVDADPVDDLVAQLEARLSDVDAGGVDAEAIAAEIIDQMPALTYDDAVAANRKALREELPDGVFKR